MQAPATNHAAAQDAQVAAAIASARAALAGQNAQELRDQAQAMRDQVQELRNALREGATVQVQRGPSPRQEKMLFAGFVIVMIAVVVILQPLARAFGRRLEGSRGGANKLDDASREQLQRIEHSMEAMAIEIERISEGQRFTTKLLSGREEVRHPLGHARS